MSDSLDMSTASILPSSTEDTQTAASSVHSVLPYSLGQSEISIGSTSDIPSNVASQSLSDFHPSITSSLDDSHISQPALTVDNGHSASLSPNSSDPLLPSPSTVTAPYSPPPREQPLEKISLRSAVYRYARSFLVTVARYVFKDNNLPLLLNIIYHLVAARTLLSKPQGAVVRYTVQPHINPAIAASNGRRILPQTSSAIQTIDAYRAIGATHLAFATLAALALKERRIASERLALVVLSVTSMGQTASHAYAYWRSQQQYTLKALQEIGGLDACITVITAIALSNTVSRTGKLL